MGMLERGERPCGKDTRVLELAGVVHREPMFYWYMERYVEDDRNYYRQVECVRYVAVAPLWTITLARRLMDDQPLVEKFGRYQVEDRIAQPDHWRRKGNAPDGKKKVIPILVRARIIGSAAKSAMSQALFEDDLEAALIMIRDVL